MVKPWKPSPMTSAMRRISAVIQGLRRCRVVGWSIWNQRVVFTQGALWVGDFVSIVLGMMFLKKNLFGIRYSHCKWYILGEKNMITRVKQHINIVDCIYIWNPKSSFTSVTRFPGVRTKTDPPHPRTLRFLGYVNIVRINQGQNEASKGTLWISKDVIQGLG